MHKSAAWPLALVYGALVVYASLYPFADWRDQGIAPWTYLFAPIPKYWSGFDVGINMAGYAPLGALLAWALLRSGVTRYALAAPLLAAAVLSLLMESIQSYLPARVASREDFVLNALGSLVGAFFVLIVARLGGLERWARIRASWFLPQARGALVLLALWPLALLFPAAVPLGLGQVFERMEEWLGQILVDTPVPDWLPLRATELQPLVPGAEMLCVALGLLVPCLLGSCVVRSVGRRWVMVVVLAGIGVGVTALSAALSWGPAHAWSWLGAPVQVGLGVGFFLALCLAMAPWRVNAAMLLLCLGVLLSLLNRAPESPYFAQTLQAWEQGRFIRFHGLAQWLGWIWPYATLVYVLGLVGRREAQN